MSLACIRCPWVSSEDYYQHYHDNEWGIPVHEDHKLFEMLILEGAQAGLSWKTILKRRDHYREVFHHFDPGCVACMTDSALEKCLQDPRIIRNRLKVFSVRTNARAFLRIQDTWGSFDAYLWSFVNNQPMIGHWKTLKDIPTSTPISDALSKDLKKHGMNFVGSTIMYAYMQAVGLLNDHTIDCYKYGLQA